MKGQYGRLVGDVCCCFELTSFFSFYNNKVFTRARASSPCIIFFDELDALCPRRSDGGGESNVTERVGKSIFSCLLFFFFFVIGMDGLIDY